MHIVNLKVNKKTAQMKLDKKEKELLKSYENDEWESVKDLEKRKYDLENYISNRKAKDKKFAKGFEEGYENFKIGVLLKQAREKVSSIEVLSTYKK